MAKRVVLAYTGGLDTSVAVRWMREEWGVEVIALRGRRRPGRGRLGRRSATGRSAAGAVEAEVVDAASEFADDFVAPALKANALYEGKYPLVSALSRPVIVKHLVAAAREHGADAVAHGCTGKGNDQVRFEVSTRALAPDLDVLAPVRVWGFTREDSHRATPTAHDIPIKATKEKLVLDRREPLGPRDRVRRASRTRGRAPPEDVWTLTDGRRADRAARDRRSASSRACPVALDGAALPLHELIDRARTTSSAPTAGAASTWSRTGGSASRAARPTSARLRSR